MTYDRDFEQPCPVCNKLMPSPKYRKWGKCDLCRAEEIIIIKRKYRMKNDPRYGVCFRHLDGGFITAEDYDEAIQDLINAKSQLRPDGNSCAICGDGHHQAWECHHNPLKMARKAAREEVTFKCFHCGQSFIDPEEATEHFGLRDERQLPTCKGKI